MSETSAAKAVCPTPCDPDCDAYCHETHDVPARREHQPEHCPAKRPDKRLTWDDLRPFERQQGGYWDYLNGGDVNGGKVWVPVANPNVRTDAVASAPEPDVPGSVLHQRPIPDQLDYFSMKLAGLLDGAKLDREMLIAIGATVVNLGAIAAQLRKSTPSGPLHPDDAAVAEVRAWLPEGTPDNALIELEAHTLRGVLEVLDGWENNAREAAAQRNAAEGRLETARVDMRIFTEDANAAAERAEVEVQRLRERAEKTERELDDLCERVGGDRWRVRYCLGRLVEWTEPTRHEMSARSWIEDFHEHYPGETASLFHGYETQWREVPDESR